MIPATFVDSSDWGILEGLMLADENFNRPNSIRYGIGESNNTTKWWRFVFMHRHVSALVMGHLQVVTNALRVLYSVVIS
jgi:hypothetical protein